MSENHVVITGGLGFIGSHLVEYFLKNDFKISIIDNLSTGFKENAELFKDNSKVEIHYKDCVQNWAEIIKDQSTQYVFHFASPATPVSFDPLNLEIMDVNSIGLRNALDYATKNGARLIFASTSEVYGNPLVSPQKESYFGNTNSFGERSCYDESKRFGEALIYSYNKRHGTQHGLVRIFNTYGERMNPNDGRVVVNFLKQALSGEPLTIYGDGQQTRSFCYVSDLVAGIVKYAQSNLTYPVNLGSQDERTILSLVEQIKKLPEMSKLECVYKDLPGDDPKQRRPDISLARKELAWEPQVGLDEGLKKMVLWLAEYTK